MEKKFSVIQSVSLSWDLITKFTANNWIVLLGIGFVVNVSSVILSNFILFLRIISIPLYSIYTVAFVFTSAQLVFAFFMYIVKIKYINLLYDDIVPTWDNSIPPWKLLFRLIVTFFVSVFAMFLLLLLNAAFFVIFAKMVTALSPKGIIPIAVLFFIVEFILIMVVGVRLIGVLFYYLVKNLTFRESIAKSWNITEGHVWKLMQYWFVSCILCFILWVFYFITFLIFTMLFIVPKNIAFLIVAFLSIPLYIITLILWIVPIRLLEEIKSE